MNKMKKFASIATAVLMTACMAAPMTMSLTSSATNVSIDTSIDKATHTYTAYQIFAGTYKTDNGLTVTGWGTDYNSTGLLADNDFKDFVLVDAVADDPGTTEVNESKAAVKVSDIVGTKTDAGTVAQAIEKISGNTAKADAMAKILAKYTGSTGTTLSNTAVDLGAGYYIVKDSYTVTDDPTNDAVSKFILKVSGTDDPIKISPKKSYPTVVKKVQENTDIPTSYTGNGETEKNYNDVADYCIGESVPFKLYGTMPSTIGDYEHYYYKFTDTLGKEFTAPGSVTIKVNGGDAITKKPADSDIFTKITPGAEGTTIEITFEDIKDFIKTATGNEASANDVITVEYTAVLNENAEIGLPGQTNEVDLTYSNNPNVVYTPTSGGKGGDETPGQPNTPEGGETPDSPDTPDSTDKAPKDKVIVFTYELDTTKVDSATKAKLAGAKFKLANAATGGKYAKLVQATDDNGAGIANTYIFDGWDTTGSEITTDTTGLFKILGLDEATYWLEETAAPDSYNKLENRVKLEIIANTLDGKTDDRQAWNDFVANKALTALSIKVDDSENATPGDIQSGIVNAEIGNSKGSSLPGTGGIGTKLFYVGGGAMVAVAGVFLITKKRMGKKED